VLKLRLDLMLRLGFLLRGTRLSLWVGVLLSRLLLLLLLLLVVVLLLLLLLNEL